MPLKDALCAGMMMRIGAIVAVLLSAMMGSSPATAQLNGDGPATLVIAYKSAPKDRAAFRRYWQTTGVERFSQWRNQGYFADSRILYSAYAGAEYDALAIIDFRHYTDLARWQEIEQTSPGGLTPEGLRYGAPLYTGIGDLIAHDAAKQAITPVYLVAFYDLSTDPGAYRSYVTGYVEPQMAGWMKAGAVARYDMYLNENTAGAPWQSMLVLDYNGLNGLARRETVKTGVRRDLAADPEWKRLSDNKTNVRTEKAVVQFELISK